MIYRYKYYYSWISSFLGIKNAAKEEIMIVNSIMDILLEISVNSYSKKLEIKQITISIAIFLSFLAGGMKIAMNIAYKATDRQLVILLGKILPILIPKAVPRAHIGTAKVNAPYE